MHSLPHKIPVFVVDMKDSYHLIRSVATAVEVAQSIKYEWKPSDLHVLCNLSGEVGFWQSTGPGPRKLADAIKWRTNDLAMKFAMRSFDGPDALFKYTVDLMKIRDQALDNIESTMREFGKINNATANALTTAIGITKAVRFAANVGLLVGSVGVGLFGVGAIAAPAFGGTSGIAMASVGLAKGISFGIISAWDKSNSAIVSSIAFETGKAGTSESLGEAGTALQARGAELPVVQGPKISTAALKEELEVIEKEVAKRTSDLARDRLHNVKKSGKPIQGPKLTRYNKLIKDSEKALKDAKNVATAKAAELAEKEALKKAEQKAADAAARKALESSTRNTILRGAGTVLRYGAIGAFAVWDMYDAIGELQE